jgi:hypothetical protein
MKTFVFVLTMGFLLVGCGEKSDKGTAGAAGGGATEVPGNYAGALGRSQNKAIKTVDTASLNQAIQMFNVDKGRNPKDLNELVQEKFIPKLPTPPVGTKLQYDATSGKVEVVKE